MSSASDTGARLRKIQDYQTEGEEGNSLNWDAYEIHLQDVERLLYSIGVMMEDKLKVLSEQEVVFVDKEVYSGLKAAIADATSGIAVVLGLQRRELQLLLKYVAFRQKYNDFTKEELARIVDKNGSISLLMDFSNTKAKDGIHSLKNISESFSNIQDDWRQAFPEQSFEKITDLLSKKNRLDL